MTSAVAPEDAEAYETIRDLTIYQFHQQSQRGLVLAPLRTKSDLVRAALAKLLSQSATNVTLSILGPRGLTSWADNLLDYEQGEEVVMRLSANLEDIEFIGFNYDNTNYNENIIIQTPNVRATFSPDQIHTAAAIAAVPTSKCSEEAERQLKQMLGESRLFNSTNKGFRINFD